MIFRRK